MKETDAPDLSRRDFLKRTSMLAGLAGAVELTPEALRPRTQAAGSAPDGPPLHVALIGFGPWGREIAAILPRLPEIRLVAICDTYDVMLQRAQRAVPDATRLSDYRTALDDPDVHAVIVATPTHTHRQIVLDALAAGKHVYCEAPLASTVEDARTIARAARDADGLIFQAGLQFRSDPQYRSLFGFIRSGALGRPAMARTQWHAKESWRRASPSRDRELELNWRLDPTLSPGLIGEVGVHQLDNAFWFLGERPNVVTGFGTVMLWDDGRTMPDTVQAIFQFPSGVHMVFDATLASSFDGSYELFFGSDSTIMVRDSKAWMFKEVDAPLLGWEVYARKDTFYRETGIALQANATKLEALGQDPAAIDPNAETPLQHALQAFLDNYHFGPYPPAAGYQEGFEATVAAVLANDAIAQGTRLTYDVDAFELG